MGWINLARDKDRWRDFARTVMNLRIPYNPAKVLSGCTTGGLSRSAQLHAISRIWESKLKYALEKHL
jgi:hypothetical protein